MTCSRVTAVQVCFFTLICRIGLCDLQNQGVFAGLSAGKLGVNTEEQDGRRCLLCKNTHFVQLGGAAGAS